MSEGSGWATSAEQVVCPQLSQPGEEDTPEGEEIQISLVPGLLRRIVTPLITDQFHLLLKNSSCEAFPLR